MFTTGFSERLMSILQHKHANDVKDKRFTNSDIHHISLCSTQFDSIPGESQFHKFFDCDIKEFDGLEFRRSKWFNKEYATLEELCGAIAFNLTGTTTRIFDFSVRVTKSAKM